MTKAHLSIDETSFVALQQLDVVSDRPAALVMWPRGALPLRSPPRPARRNLPGWPGTHSPCSPSPSRQVFSSMKKAPLAPFFWLRRRVASAGRGRGTDEIDSERSAGDGARSGTYPGERKGRHARPDKSRSEHLNDRQSLDSSTSSRWRRIALMRFGCRERTRLNRVRPTSVLGSCRTFPGYFAPPHHVLRFSDASTGEEKQPE